MPAGAPPSAWPTVRAEKLLFSERRGSSWPILVETSRGLQIVKLRGAAQGTGPLVAEVPDSFLRSLLPAHLLEDALRRRRAAYVAYLWKRLKAPRTFWSLA